MDAREKLRIYLEQRRDLGESELLLDSMTVEEALRALGAVGRGAVASSPRERASQQSGDWREVLTQAAVPEPAPPPAAGLVAGNTADELFNSEIMRHSSLKGIAEAVESCTRCPLYKTANKGVPGTGAERTRLICVGEAPGASEDETGLPFVGAAGNLAMLSSRSTL